MEKTLVLKNGDKVVVRQLTKKDSPKLFADFINQIVKERAFVLANVPFSLSEEKAWLQERFKQVSKGDMIFLVAEADGRIVGSAEARRGKWKEKANVELAIALSKEVRGRGLGEELFRELISQTNKKLEPRILYLKCFGSNKPALALYRKLGFLEVARLPRWFDNYGGLEDCVFMYLKQ